MPETTVIHVRDYDAFDSVYIGRRTTAFEASRWANPYRVTVAQTRAQAIERYEEYIRQQIASDPQFYDLEKLRGKRLACWCKEHGRGVACHGDILVKLLAEKDGS